MSVIMSYFSSIMKLQYTNNSCHQICLVLYSGAADPSRQKGCAKKSIFAGPCSVCLHGIKSTFFEKISSKGTQSEENLSKNVDFSFWCDFPKLHVFQILEHRRVYLIQRLGLTVNCLAALLIREFDGSKRCMSLTLNTINAVFYMM